MVCVTTVEQPGTGPILGSLEESITEEREREGGRTERFKEAGKREVTSHFDRMYL
jgi:hypothetical protein